MALCHRMPHDSSCGDATMAAGVDKTAVAGCMLHMFVLLLFSRTVP